VFRSSVVHLRVLGLAADPNDKQMSEHKQMDEYQEELLEYRASEQDEPAELVEDATEL
jgi:hypothetical protein